MYVILHLAVFTQQYILRVLHCRLLDSSQQWGEVLSDVDVVVCAATPFVRLLQPR